MIRVAVRALILVGERLLLVNAYPEGGRELWCAPGGGVEPHVSLPENLAREVFEETGLRVDVGALRLLSEFHDPGSTYHQLDLFFRCRVTEGRIDPDWIDPEGVVHRRILVDRAAIRGLPHRPLGLADAAWGDVPPAYDPLEPILR
jgi:8-oxo-dGTP pyrophosphatase MutT (NUDIX family)